MWVWKRNLPFKLCTKCYQKSQGSRAHAVIRNDGDDDDDELESDGVAEILDKCFVCEEKPPLKGDVMCRSCKEEHPMCYECGYRKRNLPFKLCTKCYQKSQGSRAHAVIRNDGDDDDNEIDSDGVAEILDELALDQKSGVCDGMFKYMVQRFQPFSLLSHNFSLGNPFSIFTLTIQV